VDTKPYNKSASVGKALCVLCIYVTEYASDISADPHCFWAIIYYCLVCTNLTHAGKN
jgi:hypothetical protein